MWLGLWILTIITVLSRFFGTSWSKNYKDYEVVKVGYNYYDESSVNDHLFEEISNRTDCEDMDEFIRIGPLHLLCRKNDTLIVKSIALKYHTNFEVLTNDVNKEIETAEVGRSFDVLNLNSFDHDTYLGGSSMEKWLHNLEHTYNRFMRIRVIGHSHEGRKILCVEISQNTADPVVFIDAGMHAREWIAQATSLFLIEHILKIFNGEEFEIGEFHKSEDIKKFQWHIVPNVNPDGYHYTRTEDRFWSKNRSPGEDENCMGVNLNRNFPSGFGKGPSDPCARAYTGPHPLSEPETKAVADYIRGGHLRNNTVMAISLHCFGQTLFTPFAYDGPSAHPLMELMHEMLDDATHHMLPNYYQYGLVKTYLRYKDEGIGGTSMDFYADSGIPFAYTWELPDLGQHGMLMPSRKIKEIGQEVLTGLSRMSAWICQNTEEINKLFVNKHEINIQTTTTSTPAPIKSRNNCCLTIKIESQGPSNDQHSSSMGIYEAIKYNTNNDNRYVYKKITNNPSKNPRYLYYLPIYGIWMVGNNLGQSYATLFHFDDTKCPEKLTPSWFYYDESWKNGDSSLRVSCAFQ